MTQVVDESVQIDERALRARTQGRELALKLLYILDMRGKEDADAEVAPLLERNDQPKEAHDFARRIYKGVGSSYEELDQAIADIATNWDVTRMAYIDRGILRMGAFELLRCKDIPPKVTISEAIELAKSYSTDKSSAFVNGILDKLFQTMCPEKA